MRDRPDHSAERDRRTDSSQGDAGDPDDRRRAGRLDARAMGRSEGVAAAVAGRGDKNCGARRLGRKIRRPPDQKSSPVGRNRASVVPE